MTLICRECNIEMDDDDDNPENELASHNNMFHIKLIDRCKKCMQRLYGGYHFRDRCTDKRTYATLIVHSYIDYTDINDCVNDDKNDDIDLNKTLIELKGTVKEDLKAYFRSDLKLEIINE